jgi:4-hydroxyphenylacetate 3-monooxygenase
MIRTGDEYREALRDGREVWIDGERVGDVPTHPMLKPAVDARARIFDLAHHAATADVMTYRVPETGERNTIANRPPREPADWWDKRRAVDVVLSDARGVVTRVGDETIGELWSLYDGMDVLSEANASLSANVLRHVDLAANRDPFHVSANTDPKGDRSKPPQQQDPDMLLHVVRETTDGIIVRGAKYETAAAYAEQAFVKPTIANWADAKLSDYALGFLVSMGAPGLKHICRTGFAGRRPAADYPLANRADEVDCLIIFDDVKVPWPDVFFYRDTRAASYIRSSLHRYSAFPFVQRTLRYADLLIGTALWNVRQTGLEHQQAVQEKLAQLACYREGISAHLTASITFAEPSPGGLLMPNQSLLYTGRVWATERMPLMMHVARELCGGQICLTPDIASFSQPDLGRWLDKYYSINEGWAAEDRRRLLAFARDLLNSDYAGHRLTFQLFAQSPPFAHLAAVYRAFDFAGPLELVRQAADLSDRVWRGEPPHRSHAPSTTAGQGEQKQTV